MDTNVSARFNCAVSLGASPEWLSADYAQKQEAENSNRKAAWKQYRANLAQARRTSLQFCQGILRSLGKIFSGSHKPTNSSMGWYFLTPLNWIDSFSSKQRQKGNFGG